MLLFLALIRYSCFQPEHSIQCPWEKKKKEFKQLPYLCSLSTAEKWCGIYFLDCFSALSTKQDKMLFTFPLVVLRTGMRMEDRTQLQLLCSIVPSSFAVTTYNQIQTGFLLNQMHLCYFITFCEESASSAGENYWSNSPQRLAQGCYKHISNPF